MLDLARDDDKAVLAAMLAKADVFVQNLKPGATAKLGFPLDAVAARASAADHLLDLRLRRGRPLRRAQGLRHADPGRIRAGLGHRVARRAGARRRLGLRRRRRDERLRGHPRGADRARQDRRRRRDLDLHVRRHGRLDGGAADAIRGRPAAAPHRPRAHLDRALRRVQDRRRRRHSHLDPERPRMARAGRAGARRRGARRRSCVCHQRRAGQAPRRHRRQGAGDVRRHRRRRAHAEACASRHRLRPRQRHRHAGGASAAAPHRGRDTRGRGVLSRPGRAPRRRAPALRRGACAGRAQRCDPRRVHAGRGEVRIGRLGSDRLSVYPRHCRA